MFGISGTELLIILFFGFLIFGPEKLPQLGNTVGRAIRQFRNASEAANKKFKEEVADPFHEAIAPYKEQVEETTKPFQEDIDAINSTLNETKSMFTDPFKDILSPASAQPKPAPSAVIATGVAVDDESTPKPDESVSAAEPKDAVAASGDDPFSGVISDTTSPEPKPIPQSGGTVKKNLAASLYGLDDDEGDGE